MNDSVEIFMADGRKNHQIYAVVRGSAGGRVMFAPVDRYLVSSGRQPCPELLCECFKSAVVRRNSSSPQNGYFHRVIFGFVYLFRWSGNENRVRRCGAAQKYTCANWNCPSQIRGFSRPFPQYLI